MERDKTFLFVFINGSGDGVDRKQVEGMAEVMKEIGSYGAWRGATAAACLWSTEATIGDFHSLQGNDAPVTQIIRIA